MNFDDDYYEDEDDECIINKSENISCFTIKKRGSDNDISKFIKKTEKKNEDSTQNAEKKMKESKGKEKIISNLNHNTYKEEDKIITPKFNKTKTSKQEKENLEEEMPRDENNKEKKDKKDKKKIEESNSQKGKSKKTKKEDIESDEDNDDSIEKNKKKKKTKTKKPKKKKESSSENEEEEESEEEEKKPKKKKKIKTKKIKKKKESSSENEEEEESEEEEKKPKKKKKKTKKKRESSSDNEEEESEEEEKKPKKKKKNTKKKKESSSEDNEDEESEEEEEEKKSKREKKKIKKQKESSSEDNEEKEKPKKKKKKKNTKKKKESSSEDNEEEESEESNKKKKKNKIKDKKKKKSDSSSNEESESESDKKSKYTKKRTQTKKGNKNAAPTPKSEEDSEDDDEQLEQNNQELVRQLEDKMQSVNKISEFISDNYHTIQTTKGNKEISSLNLLIQEFQDRYATYRNIKRFSIPVIGCISSGKSTLLNYLLNLKNVLEVDREITTKCICIIRHQKNLKKPRVYRAKLVYRGEDVFNFEEGEEIKKKVSEVIAEQNKAIAEGKISVDYNKYFLIVKANIPLFRGDFEKYADLFEFLDVPGLNEQTDLKTSSEKNNEEDSGINTNFYFRQIFPLFIMNVKFSLLIFNSEKYDGNSSNEIINTYLEGGIDRIEVNKKDLVILDGEEKSEQLVKIRKKREFDKRLQIKKCAEKSFQDSEFLLNKIDLSPEPDKTNELFIEYIKNYLGKKKININLLKNKNELPLEARKLNDEISKYDSFKCYLNFYCLYSSDDTIPSFYEYICEKMNHDFELDIESNEEDEDVKEKELKSDEEDYQEIMESVKRNDNFVSFMSRAHYKKLKKLFNKNKKKHNKEKIDCPLIGMLKTKIKNVIEEFLNIYKYQGLTSQIATTFRIDDNIKSYSQISEKLKKMKESGCLMIDNPFEAIKHFYNYIERIYSFEKSNKTIEKIKNEYYETYNYFKDTSAIRFLLVGPHNTGKSSVLNNIIGYDLDFLPTNLGECTKVGVIIKYIKKGQPLRMFKAKFITNKLNYNYFKYGEKKGDDNDNDFTLLNKYNEEEENEDNEDDMDDDSDYPIIGKEQIYARLDLLNKKANIKDMELRFYVIETPIEIYDKMELDDDIKKKIEIIDFPGLDTDFDQAKEKSKTLLSIIDGFIHINSTIDDNNENAAIIKLIYNTIKKRDSFNFNTCLFLLNKIDKIEEGGKSVKENDYADKILKIIDDTQKMILSTEWFKLKNKIKDNELLISKFSSILYNKYKGFENLVENFEVFILQILQDEFDKIKKSNEKSKIKKYVFKSYENVYEFMNKEDIINILNDNLKKSYLKINPKFNPGENEFNEYKRKLINIIKPYDKENRIPKKGKELDEIVKNYLYIKENKTKTKNYQNSYFQNLLINFKKIIKNSKRFFEEKRQKNILNYMENCYLQIMEVFKRVELVMRGESCPEFESIDIKEELDEIDKEYDNTYNMIEMEFSNKKTIIDDRIREEFKKKKLKEFPELVKRNNQLLSELKNHIDSCCEKFSNIVKKKNDKIISKLKLKSLKEAKDRFIENMRKIHGKNIEENNYNSDHYQRNKTVLFFFEKVDVQETRNNYRDSINDYFSNNKEAVIDNLKQNRDTGKSNIQRIYDTFKSNINGLKDHFSEFQKILSEVEQYIYREFGIEG